MAVRTEYAILICKKKKKLFVANLGEWGEETVYH